MSLKQIFKEYFKVGTSVSGRNMESERAKEELKKHYNSITAENIMKPMFYLDAQKNMEDPAQYNLKPALNFEL